MNDYGVVTVSKDESGRLIVAFPYDPQLVTKVKTIEGTLKRSQFEDLRKDLVLRRFIRFHPEV